MSTFNAYMALSDAIDGEVLQDQRMSHRTTWGIGGPAALIIKPNSLKALRRTIEVLARERVEWVILGKGSDVLVSDAGYAGCVVVLGRDFARMSINEDSTITCGAALLTSKLVSESMKAGLACAEFLAGIPGTVGGALAMNAGSGNNSMSQLVQSVVTLSAAGELKRYEGTEINWAYRSTSLPPTEIVLEATLALAPAPKEDIAQRVERRLQERRGTQPMGKPTAGEVFMNPPQRSVDKLVESCNLKGYRVGGAQIAQVNGNFILNAQGAIATDILAVMQHIHETIRQTYGIDLQPEVKFLGFSA